MGLNSKPRVPVPADLKRINCILTVTKTEQITPNMIRVSLTGPELTEVPLGCDGSHCKLQLPAPGQSREAFEAQLTDGPKPPRRTFTVRHVRHNPHEIDIDFVDHRDSGPASAWANNAEPGSFLHFSGPG